MSRFKSGIFLVLTFYLGTAAGAEYFVSNADQIDSMLASVVPGDTLTMVNGSWMNAEIFFHADGVEGQPILLRAQTPGQVVLSGTSYLQIAGEYLIVDGLYFKDGYTTRKAVIEFRDGSGTYAHHSRLTNTAIVSYNPAYDTEYKWISIYGTHNRVDHCYLRGKTNEGTTLVVWLDYNGGQPNYHLIDHNYFAYRPPLGVNGGETIRVGTSTYSLTDSYTKVEYNYFERCNGETEIISSKSCFNVYRHNTFYECEGTLTLRHGNDCTVEGNFFIGNNKSMTGGVRIIGERHKVYNNYFQDLAGTGFRSAVSLMNGVVDSPLNQYFQVKDAQVLFNTLVNCRQSITLGLGADSERSLPPLRPVMANNVVYSDLGYYLITVEDAPQEPLWEGNVMSGVLGISPIPGVKLADPQLAMSEDGLWRPAEASVVIDSAVGDYPIVTVDMDGQSRETAKDIGADESSDQPITNRPLTPEDVGPYWWPLPVEPPQVLTVGAGIDSLKWAIEQAEPGATIELVTNGGVYANTTDLLITVPLTIRAGNGLDEQPIIRQTDPAASTRSLFVIKDGGSLTLRGLALDGMAGTATPAKYLIRTEDNPMTETYTLKVRDCNLHDVMLGDDGNFFRAYAGTYADTILFRDCMFTNSGKEGIRLKDEAGGSGNFNAGYLEVTNSTFWLTRKEAISIYGGDDVPYTPGPTIRINHCTFDSCAYEGSMVIAPDQVDDTMIRNCIFSNTAMDYPAATLYGLLASIDYSNLFLTGAVVTERDASVGAHMIAQDPLYANRRAGDFTLADLSPVRGQADDGKAMGDLRWSGETLEIPVTQISELPQAFRLLQNYPNPFNPATRITFDLPHNGWTTVSIYNLLGQQVALLVDMPYEAGRHVLEFDASTLSSGVYFYQLRSGNLVAIKKMVLLK
ncbi:chondroitinase-B domain-containing protein [Candidatus Neomarinimicrobiota bacterium]